MKRRLRINSRAQRDIVQIGDYFTTLDLALAGRFLNAVEFSCRRLWQTPELGEILSAKSKLGIEYRVWRVRDFERYVIYYHVSMDTVEIVRVLHSAQDAEAQL